MVSGAFGEADNLDWGDAAEGAPADAGVQNEPGPPNPTPTEVVPAAQEPVASVAPSVPPIPPAAPVARKPVGLKTRPVATPTSPPAPQPEAPAPETTPPAAQPTPVPSDPEPAVTHVPVDEPAPVAPTAPATETTHEPELTQPVTPVVDPVQALPVEDYIPPAAPAQPVAPSPAGGAPAAYWDEPPAPATAAPQTAPQSPPFEGVNPDTSEPELTRRGRRGKKAKPAKGSLSQAAAGGRGKLLLMRGAVWCVLGLLLLGGLKNVVYPRHTPSLAEIAAQMETKSGTKGFPLSPGTAFGSRFTATYLTYNPDKVDERLSQLKHYSIEAAGSDFPVDVVKAQSIIAGPVLAGTEFEDAHNATLTYAAFVSGNKWVYLAVPVYAASPSAFVVSGAPAFVAPPALAVAPELPNPPDVDPNLSSKLETDLFPGFFEAWAKSDSVALARYTTKKPSPETLTGLGNSVTFSSVEEVKVPRSTKTSRQALVTVSWATPTGNYLQQYRVTITQGADSKWSISDIRGGVYLASGTSDSTEITDPVEEDPADASDTNSDDSENSDDSSDSDNENSDQADDAKNEDDTPVELIGPDDEE